MVHMVQNGDNVELDIVNLLLHGGSHVRDISRKLGQSHSTVSRKLNILKKQSVVDSKEEGKNKMFFLRKNLIARNYIFQSEIHKLTKLLKKHPELEIIFEEILKKTNEKLILLFGSYAKGLVKKDSDIDIYIETQNKKTRKLIEEINSEINVKIGAFDKDSPLIQEILKNHVIIRGIEKFYEKEQFFE